PSVSAGSLKAAAYLKIISCIAIALKRAADPNPRIQMSAAYALHALQPGSLSAQAAIMSVAKFLRTGRVEDDRIEAVDLLTRIRTKEAVDALRYALLHDRANYVRSSSAFALYDIADPRASKEL